MRVDRRRDFPILNGTGPRLAFLDSAASSQKPQQVLDVMTEAYSSYYSNVHRGAYRLSEMATEAYEAARAKVAAFIGAADPREIVFTRGTTTSLNMLAFAWAGARLRPGDRILLTQMEHHANLVPWQMVAARTGAELVFAPLDDRYELDLAAMNHLVDERIAVISVTGMSNVLGTIPSIGPIRTMAEDAGAILIVDGAQLVPHAPVDVKSLGADFLAFSAHKMLGPTGVGVLWGRLELLEALEPFEGGGEMIADVGLYESTWAPVPQKLEAGTPPIVEAIGLGAAVDYLGELGMGTVRDHDMELTRYALDRLGEFDHLTVYGPNNVERRGGVISFTLADVHAHDLATILDEHHVAVRAGHHCARPLMDHLGVPATARASFSVYSDEQDVDQLVDALHHASELFGVGPH